ncbi:unannotated protein [freshwater metagenome]|uniref:Unannotated protein n=1 Tax=freshwater metagenome TaxID=449393 RepID=A0A6J6AWA5_9ZZZZ
MRDELFYGRLEADFREHFLGGSDQCRAIAHGGRRHVTASVAG